MTKAGCRALIREVVGEDEQAYIVEIRDLTLVIRPKFSRDLQSEVRVTWDQVYQRALLGRVQADVAPRKRHKVKRGLLSL
jgi:hypothetical protein